MPSSFSIPPLPRATLERLLHEAEAAARAEARTQLKEALVRGALTSLLTSPATAERPPQAPVVHLHPRSRADVSPPAPATPASAPEPASKSVALTTTRPPETTQQYRVQRLLRPDQGDGQSASESTDAGAFYVYGITGYDPAASFPLLGIDETHRVYAVSFRKLQAIVSRVSLDDFGADALDVQLNDFAWVERTVRAHHAIQENIQTQGPVLPMRFCTICDDEEGLRGFLETHYDDFIATLGVLAGTQEWGVKVLCDDDRLRDVLRNESSISFEASDGAAFWARKQLERSLEATAADTRAACTTEVHETLSALAQDAVVNPPQDPKLTGRTERMVLNGAYLVHASDRERFLQALKELRESYESWGFIFEQTGPWLPYHFVQLTTDDS